ADVAGAEVGVPEVIVTGATPEHVLGTVRPSGSEGHAAEGSQAQAHRCTPRMAGRGVGVPQVAVGALPEDIDRARCRRDGRDECRAGPQAATEILPAAPAAAPHNA